jgi:hypothetical protein
VVTLVALWAVGGERCQDLGVFRTDTALAVLLGYELPAATTVRDFLEAFHAEALPLWQAGEKATVPQESAPLQGMGVANRTVLAAVQRQGPQATRRRWIMNMPCWPGAKSAAWGTPSASI